MAPFLIVVDVGHTIELFADFKSGKTYLPFPEQRNADTLYILNSGKNPDSLKVVADRWNADATWVEDGKKPKPHQRATSEILRVWWA